MVLKLFAGAGPKSSGSAVAPGLEGLNARGPLKVHPKWRLEESAMAPRAVAGPSAIARNDPSEAGL